MGMSESTPIEYIASKCILYRIEMTDLREKSKRKFLVDHYLSIYNIYELYKISVEITAT